MKKFLLALVCFSVFIIVNAQDSSANVAEDATGMRSNEKIYVVVTVLGTILAGIFIYLIRLDKKISRMEKEEKK